jgi:hypothetical protein
MRNTHRLAFVIVIAPLTAFLACSGSPDSTVADSGTDGTTAEAGHEAGGDTHLSQDTASHDTARADSTQDTSEIADADADSPDGTISDAPFDVFDAMSLCPPTPPLGGKCKYPGLTCDYGHLPMAGTICDCQASHMWHCLHV